ncbi:MAG TPA: hypothetical protein DER09_14935, partial [Prolixibacteraceae bacterium]|nr:hypothetical protein [Prolixibacteraceae bacterium]
MPIINSVVQWLNFKRNYQIQLYREHPIDIQFETLFSLISSARDTEWGLAHGFDKIETLQDFQNAMPLQNYDDIKPYVERLREGEKNVLWPGEVKWFAKSSGTTSDKSKFIPVTKESLDDCHLRGPKDVFALYL